MEKITTLIDIKTLLIYETVCQCGYKAKDVNEAFNIRVKNYCRECYEKKDNRANA